MPHEKIKAKAYKHIAYDTEWWQVVDIKEAKTAHAKNIAACHAAMAYHDQTDRPINILAIHGSSRSNSDLSCAHELSNSQLLLRKGLEVLDQYDDVEVEEVNLREYRVEYCNNCYSTCSALCGFPCNCFPFDPMQRLYPKVLACDVMLMSTGVNQSAMSSRLKAFVDRLISLDGGYYVTKEQFASKDSDWRNKAIATSQTQPIFYDQRMHGRVAAFFISSKDDADVTPTGDYWDETGRYVDLVHNSLYKGFWDYGFYFADPWMASFSAKPDEELSLDKKKLSEDVEAHKQARQVVLSAYLRAKVHRLVPPEPRGLHPVNRT